MKHIDIEETLEEFEFVKKASERMSKDNRVQTFGILQEGSFFAIRWGLGEDCLMVFKIGDEPRLYGQVINKDQEGR